MVKVSLSFANASCAHCARLVRQSLGRVGGVFSVKVDPEDRSLEVGFDPSRLSVDSLRSSLEGLGYPTRLLGTSLAANRQYFPTQKAA